MDSKKFQSSPKDLGFPKLPNKQLFRCQFCDKCFIKESHLKQHKKIHSAEENRFECNTCGKYFKGKMNLSRHKKFTLL